MSTKQPFYVTVANQLVYWGISPDRQKIVSADEADRIAFANQLNYAEGLTRAYDNKILLLDDALKIVTTEDLSPQSGIKS